MNSTSDRFGGVKFSVVIPVYNVQDYLPACVNSILEQKEVDYEILLVDDGSTDASGEMCDSLSVQYPCITVIHQKNGGLSAARNAGMRRAAGDYLLFVDSDDYIAPDILKSIENVILRNGKPDVVFLEAVKVYPDGRMEPMKDGYVCDHINGQPWDDVLLHLTTLPKFPGSACTKAVRRDVIETEDCYFTEGIVSEDIEWCYRLFGVAETYAYLPDVYYFYRQNRAGSITHQVSTRSIESQLWIVERWAAKKPVDRYRKCINSFVAYQYMILLLCMATLGETAHDYWKRVIALKWISRYGKSKKLRLVRVCVSIVGVKATAQLLKMYKKC